MKPSNFFSSLHNLSITNMALFLLIGITSSIYFPIKMILNIDQVNIIDVTTYLILLFIAGSSVKYAHKIINTSLAKWYRIGFTVVFILSADTTHFFFSITIMFLFILILHQFELENLFQVIRRSIPADSMDRNRSQLQYLDSSAEYINTRLKWMIDLDIVLIITGLIILTLSSVFHVLDLTFTTVFAQNVSTIILVVLLLLLVTFSYRLK